MNIPTTVCYTEPDYVYNIKNGEILDNGAQITAVSAIGQPEQFYKFLTNFKIKKS